jgi:hypothetical protein
MDGVDLTMLGTAMLTIFFTAVYLGVSLLFPAGKPMTKPVRKEPAPRHKAPASLEQQYTDLFIEAWMKGEEHWIRYAWIEPTEMTWNWG